ncbi:MAG TPA: HlyD family efflux transporter periplasmic adaptor subunit [Anaerolineales bacterium]|nr:HlyD family efflux transporter periplasmic adaptor subunit [Anaerolineales bacterium]
MTLVILGLKSLEPIPTNGFTLSASQTQSVQADPTAAALTIEGQLVPRSQVSLSTEMDGQVAEIMIQEGDWVTPGTPLLRLDNREQLQANVAAAEYELIIAQQMLDGLYEEVQLDSALQEKALAETQKELARAEGNLKNLSTPATPAEIEQVYANLLLAEIRLEMVEEDIRIWEKRQANKQNIYWTILKMDRGDFNDILEKLEWQRINAQRQVDISQEKNNDLLYPDNEFELAQAEAQVNLLQAQLDDIEREISTLQNGPDPDAVADARVKLQAAEAGLMATQSALDMAELVAPQTGRVAEITVEAGEWIQAGQPALILIDDSQWVIEIEELTEKDVPQVEVGQAVSVQSKVLPELELSGSVESIRLLSREERGKVYYTVAILLDQTDPHLRWGMTVDVIFQKAVGFCWRCISSSHLAVDD